MDLIEMVTSQLGVDDSQARGGTGLLLKLARDKLGSGDFGRIRELLPDADALVSAAPEAKGGLGALGGLLSKFGGGKMGDLATLASGFSALNLDKSKIAEFIPVVLKYFQDKGGDDVKGLLEKILK